MYDPNSHQMWLHYADDKMEAYTMSPSFVQLLAEELTGDVWSALQIAILKPRAWIEIPQRRV